MSAGIPWLLAIDGGGTKTDVLALSFDGEVLAHVRGGALPPQIIGPDATAMGLDALVGRLAESVARADLRGTAVHLSGLDFAEEIAAIRAAARHRWWLPEDSLVDNDLFALLRAGTSAPDAAAVVVGTGINAIAVRADGITARYPALGGLSGDWGGGISLGASALWHAARGADGRGPRTSLEASIPSYFGVATLDEVIAGLHFGRLDEQRLPRLAEVLFDAARAGDAVAGALVDRQADEVVTMAEALLVRLGLAGAAVPIVLGGGVLAADDRRLMGRIREGIGRRLPRAEIRLVADRPVLGSALLVLESRTTLEPGQAERLRDELARLDTAADLTPA